MQANGSNLVPKTKLEEKMAGKGRKAAQPGGGEEADRSESGSEIQMIMKMFLESTERAEERAENRRREERIAAEERAEERAEAKRIRRAEEVLKAEEKEAAKEEAAKQETERLREQQEAINNRMYEQQVALVKLQADIGEKAADAYRLEQGVSRKKERAVFGIANYREEEDIEDFLSTSERKLRAGGVPEAEWQSVIASKLSGKIGSTWHDLCVGLDNYFEVKAGLLRVCGYTPKLAGELFFGFKAESIKGMSANQLYNRGVQLARRMMAPQRLTPEMEFGLMKPWVWSVVPKKARMVLDGRKVNTAGELIEALQDYLVMEGERNEGQAAVFGRQGFGGEGGRERVAPLTCFSCGRPGHKAADCWGSNNSNSYQPGKPADSAAMITCFTCGEPGHKSTVCPNKEKLGKASPNMYRQVKAEPKEVKPLKKIRMRQNPDTMLSMKVNSQIVPVLLDSGSAISVVPERMVADSQRTGEVVAIKGFGADDYIELPMAEVPFEVGGQSWVEPVALSPREEKFEEEGVVFGLKLWSARGRRLVALVLEGSVDENFEEEQPGEEDVDKPLKMRTLVMITEEEMEAIDRRKVGGEVGGAHDVIEQLEPDASLVKGAGSEPEACTQVSYNFANLMCPPLPSSRIDLEEEQQEPRAAPFSFVGGDVGIAHRRRMREKEKEREEEYQEEEEART